MCRSVSTGDLSSCQTVQVKEADERFERIRRVESDAIEEAIETFFPQLSPAPAADFILVPEC